VLSPLLPKRGDFGRLSIARGSIVQVLWYGAAGRVGAFLLFFFPTPRAGILPFFLSICLKL